uniref:neuroblast differentiation-associated protein AHNAK n=1 Tax=Semicossyphus pulcher TaxID=241346 RepID=UPI0037E73E80
MCDCFHLAFPNWHAASSETGARRLRGAEPVPEDNSICDEPSQFTEGERPRPQGSSPVEEYPEMEKYTDSDKECEGEHDPHRKSGGGKKSKKSGLGSMFEKRSTQKICKLKEAHSPESEVIVKTAQDGCAEGLIYGGGGREGIFIKEVVPESPASKSLKLKEGDQVLSATVYFDNVPYEDAIQILGHAQAYKVKLCLKRKPDVTETEPIIESDAIPEDEMYAPEMREQGKTKRRSDARISWPKFHTLGRKSHFTRSHSSSEADEQRKLELSPTTSDTESPIKSQDALKGKKRNKMRLSFLKKRGRVSSTEDQDTDTPTTGQISGKILQTHDTSDMLSPECLESPTEAIPAVYVTEDLKVVEDFRPEQNDQKLSHKMELITIDSTLKTEDLTVALADQESPSGIKSPDGKKKKKERSELKMKILGKDKSHKKDAKAKSSPKRLKTMGASIEIADQPENEKSKVIPSFETHKELTGGEQALDAKTPIMELDISDVALVKKSPKKEEKPTKGKDSKQKQETKTGPTFKLPKIGFSDITTEKDVQKMNVNAEECTTKIEHPTTDGVDVKEDPYERLSKGSMSRTQLPKREDIEIPGMEDMSARTKAKGFKAGYSDDTPPSEIIPLSIDVDSVKEAVSKLPGFKLPKVDTSGVLIPEEITVIDANAQRISVKTPTKVVDTKTKHETHFTKFDITASPNISKTTVKLPKITPADLTSEVLVIETKTDFRKPEMKYKTEEYQRDIEIKTAVYKREDIIIPGKESAAEVAFLQAQEDKKSKKMKRTKGHIGGVISDVKMPEIDSIEYIDSVGSSPAEKEGGIRIPGFGVNLDAAKPNVDIYFPEIRSEVKDAEGEEHTTGQPKFGGVTSRISLHVPDAEKGVIIDGTDMKSLEREGHGTKFKLPNLGISMPKVKGPKIDLSKKDGDVTLPGAKAEAEVTLGRIDVSVPQQKINVEKPELDGQGGKIKMPEFGIKMPKFKGPQFDSSLSKKDAVVTLPEAKVEVKLPQAPEIDVKLAKVDVSVPEQKMEVKKPELEIKPLQTEGELDRKGGKIKMPKFGISMPKLEGPDIDFSFSKKDADVTLPEAKAEVGLPEVPKMAVDITPTKGEAEMDVQVGKSKRFGITMPKVPEIDFNLSKKDIDVTLPEARADVKLPDAALIEPSAKVEVKVSKSKGAEKNVEGSPSKYKMPTFKLPKFGGATPDAGVEISAKSTQLKSLEEGVAVDMTAPNIDIEGPSLDVKKTQAEFEGKGGKFKMPKFGISIPKVKGPEMDLRLSQKEVDLPEAKAEVKLPEVEYTEPGFKVEIKAPEVGMPTDINIPEAGLNVNIAAPSTDTALDMKTRTDLDGKGSKFKMPHLGFSLPKAKGPKLDFSLSKKNVDVKLPEVDLGKVDVSIPEHRIEGPDAKVEVKLQETTKIAVEMKPPEFEADEAAGKFKMPKFGINLPKVKGPEIDLSLSKKDVDMTLPQTKVEVKLPDAPIIDVGLGKAEISIPEVEVKKPEVDVELEGQGGKFQMPKFGITIPKVKGPEIDFNLSKKDVHVTLPEANAEVKLPDVDLKKPSADVEIEAPKIETQLGHLEGSSKFKLPTFKLPTLGAVSLDSSAEVPDKKIQVEGAELKISKDGVTHDIAAQNINIVGPSLDVKITETEGLGKESKFKVPKFGISLPKVQGPKIDVSSSKKGTDVKLPDAKVQLPEVPEIDLKLGKVDVSIPEAKIEVKKPQLEMKPLETEGELDGQESKFKLPKFGISMPKVKGPEIDFSLSKKDENITLPEAKAEVIFPDVKLKEQSAKVEIKAPEIEAQSSSVKASPSKFKMPTFKLPKFGVGTPNVSTEVPDMDKEIKIEGADMQITVPHTDIDVKVKGGEIDMTSPGIDAKVDGEGSKFNIPKFGITIPQVTGPEIDLSLSKKDVEVKLPEAKAEVKLPDIEMKKPSAKMEIKAPEIKVAKKDTEGSPSKYKMPTFKLPKFGVGMPSATVELPETNKDLKIDDVDIKIPEEVLKVDIAAPSIDTEGSSIDMKMTGGEYEGKGSKFKMPKFGISMPKVTGPEIDLSLSKKDVDVTLPEAKAEVKLPDVELKKPSAEMEIKAPEIKVATKDKEGSPSKFKMPTFKLPKFGIGTPSATVELPETNKDLKIDGADIKIPEEVLTVDIAAPSMDIEGPSIDMKMTGTEHEGKGSKFKMPKFGISMPKVTGPEIDLSLSKKDVDVTLPEAKVEVKLPEAELKKPTAELEMQAPEIKVATKDKEGSPLKFKMPTFKLPKFGIGTPSATVELPDINKDLEIDGADIKIPEEVLKVDIAAPSMDIEGPSIDMKMTGTEHEGKGSKFKMPKFGISMPKVTGPEIDLSLSKKDVDVTLPEAKAEVKLPEVELKEPSAELEIKAPEIKVSTKDKEGSPSKFKMPTFKLPKFGVGTPSATVELPETNNDLKIDGADIKIPEEVLKIDIAAPSIDIEGPSIDMKMTGTEHEGKGSKFKMPKFGISMPKVTGPEIDLSLSKKDVDVTLPEAKAEVKLPEAELKKPSAEMEIKAPEIKVATKDKEASPSKYKMPTFKLPKFGVSMPSATVELPETNKDLKIDGADIKIPEEVLKVEIAAPSIDTEGSSIDMKMTGTEHEGKGSKFKMPKFGISMPKVTGPEIDLSLSKKDVDVTLPEAKAEVKLPDVELKKPSAEMEIKAPEIKVATKDKEGSPSKFKMPTFKLPKFGIGTPSATVELPETNKDLKIDGADIKIPEEVLTVDIAAPSMDIEGPSIDMKTTGTEHEGKGSKFKMPKFGISMPKVTGPEIDLSLSKKDVDVTLPEAKAEVKLPEIELKKPSAEMEIKAPEIKVATKDKEASPSKYKMPTFKLPKFGVSMPSATVELPETNKDLKIDGADIKIPEEVLKVDIAAPSIDTEGSSIDMKMTGTEHEGKGSKFKMPKFGISMPKVTGPEIDLSLSKKDVDVTLPEAKAEVKLPEAELKKPSAEMEIKAPEIKVSTKDKEGSPSKYKMPTFKLPKFGVSLPSATVELPETNKDLKIDDVDIKIPEEVLTVDIAAPSMDIEGPSIDMKMTGTEHEGKGSKFKMPKFGISMPKVTGPEIDLSLSKKDVDVTLPEAKAEVKLPEAELKKPSAECEIKAPEIKVSTKDKEGSPSKFKMPTFKLPKFGIGTPSATVELPETNKDLKIDGADIKIPEEVLTVDIAAPSMDIEGPSIDMKMTGTEHEGKGSKFKMPKFGISMPKVTGPEIDLSLSKKDVDVTLPEAKAEVKLPEVELKKPSAEMEIKAPEIKVSTKDKEGSPSKYKMPTFKFPKFGVGMPSATVELPETNKDLKIDGADIKIPEDVLTVDIAAPSIDTEGSSIDMKMTGSEHEGKGSKFKMPKFGISMPKVTGPEIDLSLSKKDVDVTLPEAKAEVKLPEAELKKPSAELEIKAPQIKVSTKGIEGSPSKFKMPTFKLPKFGVGTVEVPDTNKDLKIDGADIKIPEEVLTVNIGAPSMDIEGPSIDMKTSGTEHEGKGSKFKMPSLGFPVPQGKQPDIDLSLSMKDVDVTLPEAKAQVQLSGVELKESSAKVVMMTPGIDVQTSNIEGSPTKFKMPTFKLPKFGASTAQVSVEAPDVDKNIKSDGVSKLGATVEVSGPSIDNEGQSVDLKAKGSEMEGSGSKFKLPNLGISMSKVKGPEIDISLSKTDVDVTLPEAKAEVKLPDVEVVEPKGAIAVPDAPAVEVDAKLKKQSWTFPKFSFSRTGAKAPDVDVTLETPKEEVSSEEVLIPKAKGPQGELHASQKDVDITLPKLKAQVKLPEIEVKSSSSVEIKVSETEAGGSPLKLKDQSINIKTDVSKEAITDYETPANETESLGSPSKFKLPSFKMPKLSFSRSKPEDQEDQEADQLEIKIEAKEESKSPKMTMTSFGEMLKNMDVEFDVPKTDTVEESIETSKEVPKTDELGGKQLEAKEKETPTKQDATKSPEKTGWFKFPKFGLSSPSEPAKNSEKDKDEKSPEWKSVDDTISPTCSYQSSDAFADISSAMTSEHVGLSLSSPTKVTVKYSDPNAAAGLGEVHSKIITSTTRTELISVEPNLPEKITILSSGVSSSSEDTLRLESGKIHVITSNIEATPESQHAKLLTTLQVQSAGGLPLKSDSNEAASWTVEDSQSSKKTIFDRHLLRTETSSERSESKETIVITKQITRMLDSAEHISGETASSIQRLKDTVHSEKMRFFDEAEK